VTSANTSFLGKKGYIYTDMTVARGLVVVLVVAMGARGAVAQVLPSWSWSPETIKRERIG